MTEAQAWENWIVFMLKAVEATAQQTFDQVERILNLIETTREQVQLQAASIYSKDLIELIFRQPYTKIAFLVDAGIAKRQTASRYLQVLVELGVLREELVGREKYYINDALFAELTRKTCRYNRHIDKTCRFLAIF